MNFILILSWIYAVLTAVSALPRTPLQPPPQPQQDRQGVQVRGFGGGSPGRGYDVNLDARAPVYTSGNKRHQVDALGGYSQHLGGAGGSSKPQPRVGVGYTYRF